MGEEASGQRRAVYRVSALGRALLGHADMRIASCPKRKRSLQILSGSVSCTTSPSRLLCYKRPVAALWKFVMRIPTTAQSNAPAGPASQGSDGRLEVRFASPEDEAAVLTGIEPDYRISKKGKKIAAAKKADVTPESLAVQLMQIKKSQAEVDWVDFTFFDPEMKLAVSAQFS